MKKYSVQMEVEFESDLTVKELNDKLVLALYNGDADSLTPDNCSDNLRITEYNEMTIQEEK
jgi:hypothetical protein